VNKKLQSGEKEINLHTSRGLYNQLMSDIPELSSHLAADAKIVVDKDFESAIEKIQGENEANLRPAEKRAVQFLLKSDASGSESKSEIDDDQTKSDSSEGYADSAIKAIENAKRNRIFKSKYVPLKHLTSTVCVCERLFSRTKIIMHPHRASMQPWHLELLVFLRVNKSLWVSSIQ
jgi:hypothetical protein